MVAYIIAIGLLVVGVAYFFLRGGSLGSDGVAPAPILTDEFGTPIPKGTWVSEDGTQRQAKPGATGYSPPPRKKSSPSGDKVTYVPPSTGPLIEARSGRGHF